MILGRNCGGFGARLGTHFGVMRGVMAAWMAVAAIVSVTCVVVVTAEDLLAVGEAVAINRHFPRSAQVISDSVPAEHGIGFRGHRVEPLVVAGDRKRMQWNFNPFNPFQTFGVRREGHVRKKCGVTAKFKSWGSNMFGQGHEHHHDHRHYHHHHGEEHHHEHHHEHWFGRSMEHRHGAWSMEPRASFGWDLLSKIGRWFSGIPSFLSDAPALIKNWSTRASGRKPPTVESVTEPLDMHALHKTSSPSLSCTLREKLFKVYVAVSEEVDATSGITDNGGAQPDTIKRNLKKFMGDSIQIRITKSICDSASMSSCEQDFCNVFLSHPKSGVLLAFQILGLNPVRAAIKAARLSSSRSLSRSELSKSEMDMIINLKKSRRLAHIVFQRVLAANPTETVPDFTHKLKSFVSKFSGGELNPCKACLRQEIFRMKRLTKKAMVEVCENPVDSHLEQSCKFAKENKFVFKTLFAYKFRLWEKPVLDCRTQKACDSLPTPTVGTYEPASITLEKEEELHNHRFAHFDVHTLRNPRGVEASPAVMARPLLGGTLDCRQRALHRAAMLRGYSLDVLSSELLKIEVGPIIVVEFVARPQMENNQETNSFPMGAFLRREWNFLHSEMNFERGFAGSAQFDPLRDMMKTPLLDSSPVHPDAVIDDSFVKPQDVPDVTSISTEIPIELPSSNDSSTEHPDM